MEYRESTRKFIGIGIGIAVAIAIIFTPFIPASSTEQYVEMQTKNQLVQEIQTQSQPHQELETKNQRLISANGLTIKPNTYMYWSAFIPIGRDVEFAATASDTLDTYVLTSSEFANYQSGRIYYTVAQRTDSDNARYGFHTWMADTYYFVVWNPHIGFLGFGSKNVVLYSVAVTATWQEMVTKYKQVQVPVTISREITKNLSVMQILMRNSNSQIVTYPNPQVGEGGSTETSVTETPMSNERPLTRLSPEELEKCKNLGIRESRCSKVQILAKERLINAGSQTTQNKLDNDVEYQNKQCQLRFPQVGGIHFDGKHCVPASRSRANYSTSTDPNEQCQAQYGQGSYYDSKQNRCLGGSVGTYAPVDQNAECQKKFWWIKGIYYDGQSCVPPGGWDNYKVLDYVPHYLEGTVDYSIDASGLKDEIERSISTGQPFDTQSRSRIPYDDSPGNHHIIAELWFSIQPTRGNSVYCVVHLDNVIIDGIARGNKQMDGNATYHLENGTIKGNKSFSELQKMFDEWNK